MNCCNCICPRPKFRGPTGPIGPTGPTGPSPWGTPASPAGPPPRGGGWHSRSPPGWPTAGPRCSCWCRAGGPAAPGRSGRRPPGLPPRRARPRRAGRHTTGRWPDSFCPAPFAPPEWRRWSSRFRRPPAPYRTRRRQILWPSGKIHRQTPYASTPIGFWLITFSIYYSRVFRPAQGGGTAGL